MSTEVMTISAAVQTTPAMQATPLLDAIARAAADPATDIEKMERLFAMHQKMVAQQSETEFHAAMSRCQSRMQTVARNRRNDQTNSRYADLTAIVDAIKPIYTEEGFSISFDTSEAPKENYLRVIAILAHKGGHSRQYHLDLPPDEAGIKGMVNKTKVHATGSTNSYARRYLICMAFNIQTGDDTDGNKGKTMPDGQRADFELAIEALDSKDAADALWKSITAATTQCGDVETHDHLRALMAAKRRNLK